MNYTTGDIARSVGCDDLTVRRYLADKGLRPKNGTHMRFTERQYRTICFRLNAARLVYGKHIRRYERPTQNGQLHLNFF